MKNIAATVKLKAENAYAEVEEKKEDTKFRIEEMVEKMKARDNEDAKIEATQRRDVREIEAERQKDQKERENVAERERAINPHPGPIGDRPSPADLDMGQENPTAPKMGGEATNFPSASVPNFVGPSGGTVA